MNSNPESRIQNKEVRMGKDTQRQSARTFSDLLVWQKSHQFVLEVYEFTKGFPPDELYGLTCQFRRAAVSIPANIAEGFKRRGKPDKARFLNISQASLEECRYYLLLAKDLKYGHQPELLRLLEEVSKVLDAYSSSIQRSLQRPAPNF
jgi:four helix bundle protein